MVLILISVSLRPFCEVSSWFLFGVYPVFLIFPESVLALYALGGTAPLPVLEMNLVIHLCPSS